EPLGNAALSEAMRYWTQAELNSRLVEFSGALLFNRILCALLAVVYLAITLWRFTMTERAPSKRRLRRLAKRQAKEAALAAVTPATGGDRVTIRDARPSVSSQFMTRLRIEMRMVLTSPGLIVLTLFAVANTAGFLWFAIFLFGTVDHPTLSAVITGVSGNFQAILLMIAGFYGGELVWRERDRKFNELIDSTPVPSWVMTVPKILAIFLVLLVVNLAAMATGLFYQMVNGSHFVGIPEYLLWFIIPAALGGLLIAVLAVFLQVLSPNKYVGWGLLFLWFVARIFLSNTGHSHPLYRNRRTPNVPQSDFVGQGSFWKGQAVFLFYWL